MSPPMVPVLIVVLFTLAQLRTWAILERSRADVKREVEDIREEFGTRLARLEARARLGLDDA